MMPASGTSTPSISILYVDDEPALLEIGRIFLEKGGGLSVSTCGSADQAIELLSHQRFDAIVSDYQMPGMNGLQFLQHLRKTGNQTPFIIFTGKGREDVVIEALNSGADFYLQKGGDPKSQFAELSNKILYAVTRKQAEEEILRKNEELAAAEEEMRSQLEEIITIRDQLEESNEYLNSLISNANAPIIVWDPDYTITRINHAFEDLTGIVADEIVGQKLPMLFPEKSKDELMVLIDRAMEGERLDAVEIPIIHQSGTVRNVIWNSAAIMDNDGITLRSVIAQGQDITERKAAEERLRKYQRREADIINFLPDATFAIDSEGVVIAWNRAIEEMTNIPAEEMLGKCNYEYALPFYHERRPLLIDLALRDDPDIESRYPYVRRKGDTVFSEITLPHLRGGEGAVLWFTASRLYDGEGNVTGAIESIRDITDRKQLEEELQRSRNRYRSLVSNVPGVVYRCLLDSDWTMLYLNADIEKITGYPGTDFIQNAVRTYASIIHPDDIAYVERSINEAVRANEPWEIEYRIRTRNGDIRWVYENGRAAIDGDGDTQVLDGIIIDITDKKEVEEMVKSEQAFTKTLLETSPAFFVAIGLDGAVLKMNNALLEALEYEEEDLIGKDYLTAIVPEEEHGYLADIFSQIMNNGESTINQNHIISRTGRRILVEWHGRRASSGGMAPDFIVGVGIDITGRIQAEDSLREANRKLSLLSSITRHDIMNKIMTIKGYLEVAEDIEKDRELEEYLEQLKNAADAIEKQIEFTRQYDQIAINEPEWISLSDLLDEIDDPLLPITAVCDPVLIYVEPMMGKVFTNLYDNTLRHAEGATGITIRCLETDAGLLISWEDDGPGIPYDQKEKIFESGFGRHTGFGLFLVREILDITGITISETGVPGEGARFEILVPKGGFCMNPSMEERDLD